MPESPTRPRRSLRLSALPGLVAAAPPRVTVLLGVIIVALGALIVIRPLTSLVLLGVYVGASAIVSGVLELAPRRAPPWWARALAIAWIAGGLVILVWLGRSIELLPPALALLLIVGGLASLGEAMAGGVRSARVLAVAWGGAQIAFGALSLTWPDLTLLVVAVVFGVRTVIFGVTLLVRGIGAIRTGRSGATDAPDRPSDRVRWGTALGRYALSLVLVLGVVGGVGLDDWLSDGAPVVDGFYDPPDTLPSGHGRLIRTGDYLGREPARGTVSRILYTTEDARGRPAAGSGMVIVPKDPPPGPRPVLIWNHGTTGVARGCAPSLADGTATKWAIPDLERMLARGWVVVAPDYSGQGAPGDFPYLIGTGEARSALDAVLAAGEIDDLVLSPQTVVWGHSQGGHAALWTTQIAPEYTPGIDILGTAALAPAADPAELAQELTSGDAGAMLTVLVAWVLVPYADTYPDVELNDYVATGARPIVREMTQRCLSEPGVMVSALTALGLSEDSPFDTGNLTTGALGRRLEENVPTGPWGTPILVAWGTRDEVIPITAQQRLVQELCSQGERVRAVPVPRRGHQDMLQPKSALLHDLARWTNTLLLAEVPPASVVDDCAR
ncbi:alpha/beta fold hydrolase [Microbacterium sp. cx-55]|uniref:alpha/beta fold hydrolase n=1 Tax=Microbacterium sp. cx-55 TaxID=2875948 RepID=UPI001CBF167C|nr:alpha/beta fold hydrolase [Microbacterium sp. cx-55]MBZ4488549.1 alpha/beta fold hydrolase [Microbacterium sp. cx-55]UGB36132.1 alpha/beta fold hydrolase [Microbacterium sp. cx-55]